MMQTGKGHRVRRSHAPAILRLEREAVGLNGDDLAAIRAVVLQETRADLSDYRTALVRDAVAQRMADRHTQSIPEYARYVRQFAQEASNLLAEIRPNPKLLVQEPTTLEALRAGLSGVLSRERRPGDRFRAWIPCCGTGEEVYSIAITVLELLELRVASDLIQVFGTDLDSQALETARAGIYSESLASEIAAERRLRFFRQDGPRFRFGGKSGTFAFLGCMTPPKIHRWYAWTWWCFAIIWARSPMQSKAACWTVFTTA